MARAAEYQSRKRSSYEKATSSSSPSSAVQDELLDTGDTTCNMSDDSDPDTTLSEWNTRKLNQKPDKITLQIPRKGLAKALSPGAARMKLSKRQTFAFTCDLIRLGEGKVSDFSLSSSGVYYQRKQAEGLGSKLLSKFLDNPNVRYLIIHWDGKIVKYMDGLTEDRIVLVLQAVG